MEKFEALDVMLQGNHVFEVPDGYKIKITTGDSGLAFELKPIDGVWKMVLELQDNGQTCSFGIGGVIGGLTDTLPTFVNHGSQLGLVIGSGLVEQPTRLSISIVMMSLNAI